ncbi:cytosolic sulfotransferase 12-like [Phoenix dactylifera]|uniref:Sulfotransferase n=1 Tax=Phoenix dactylifera TaxID=42345 RepID=A0A8B8ZK50_PHODC|nr:cytosolic sulfotransferase 12-like [Phoenix dactylifera]
MAAPPSSSSGSLEAHHEEEDRTLNPPREYNDFVSTLPLEEGWVLTHLRECQGFWFSSFMLAGVMAVRQRLKPRPDDLFLMNHPKTGTTWLKALTFAIMTRSHHPLLSRNPHDCVLYLEGSFAVGEASRIEAATPPRIFSSHIPYSILPDSITGSDCRMIYVCRDPKDVLISWWHYRERMRPETMELFCEGRCNYGPVWEHVLEFWRESRRRPEKVLFVKYEEMLEEPVGSAKRLAEFMGCPFSPEEEKEGVLEDIVRLRSFENLRNLEVNRTGRRKIPVYGVMNASLFRKGEVGDWRNHMSPEMARRMNEITQEKLKGSGLILENASLEAAPTG